MCWGAFCDRKDGALCWSSGIPAHRFWVKGGICLVELRFRSRAAESAVAFREEPNTGLILPSKILSARPLANPAHQFADYDHLPAGITRHHTQSCSSSPRPGTTSCGVLGPRSSLTPLQKKKTHAQFPGTTDHPEPKLQTLTADQLPTGQDSSLHCGWGCQLSRRIRWNGSTRGLGLSGGGQLHDRLTEMDKTEGFKVAV